MRILFIGGTKFVGRWMVDAALAANHEVTLFHRGKTNTDIFPEVEHRIGDRDSDLSSLNEGTWDAVIDTSGYTPKQVHRMAELLKDRVETYTFISTVSVYDDPVRAGADENAPLKKLSEDAGDEVTGATYGALKVLAERALDEVFEGRVLHIRPGLVVGPHDPTDRFTYWVDRLYRGGEVLVPGKPEKRVQFIDARDLGEFTVKLTAQKTHGYYNATGPGFPLTWGRWMDIFKEAFKNDVRLTWVNDTFLEQQPLKGNEFPFWVPEPYDGLLAIDTRKAISAGLTFRPLHDTIQDTFQWDQSRERDQLNAGLSSKEESHLLKSWHG